MTQESTLEDIDIPENVFVPCPIGGNWDNVRVATACLVCKHFNGLFAISRSGNRDHIAALPFIKRYHVNCAHPRPIEMLEVRL